MRSVRQRRQRERVLRACFRVPRVQQAVQVLGQRHRHPGHWHIWLRRKLSHHRCSQNEVAGKDDIYIIYFFYHIGLIKKLIMHVATE